MALKTNFSNGMRVIVHIAHDDKRHGTITAVLASTRNGGKYYVAYDHNSGQPGGWHEEKQLELEVHGGAE